MILKPKDQSREQGASKWVLLRAYSAMSGIQKWTLWGWTGTMAVIATIAVTRYCRSSDDVGDSPPPESIRQLAETTPYPKHTFNLEEWGKCKERFMQFEGKFPNPVTANDIFNDANGFDEKEVQQHMESTYPLVHGSTLLLAHRFLLLKKHFGSAMEQDLYKDMTLTGLFDRFVTKRPVCFFGVDDIYTLRDKTEGNGNWEWVGTDPSQHPFNDGVKVFVPDIAEYLSYDEMMLSALIGMSSPTNFINDGNRMNAGRRGQDHEPPHDHEKYGILMGLVGMRMEKWNVMEYALMVLNEYQNTKRKGYGYGRLPQTSNDKDFLKEARALHSKSNGKKRLVFMLFEDFYSTSLLEWKKENRFMSGTATDYVMFNPRALHQEMWRCRMRITLELFLFESDHRAKREEKKAFCHLVGLGAGVWAFDNSPQGKDWHFDQMVEILGEIVKSTSLPNIGVIYFQRHGGWTKKRNCHYDLKDKSGQPIKVRLGEREPSAKMTGKYYATGNTKESATIYDEEYPAEDYLLSACFAWDMASFAGNEYYRDALTASGDPAAAASSTITYVQNPEINTENVKGKNARFFFVDPDTGKYDVYKLSDIEKGMTANKLNKGKWLAKSARSIPYRKAKGVSGVDMALWGSLATMFVVLLVTMVAMSLRQKWGEDERKKSALVVRGG